ncbi:GATOR complex protein WDR24 [Lamellibrachia satsuma]|nr:GATOR complex protein WDR24 [Lamellibrachia satsuma]
MGYMQNILCTIDVVFPALDQSMPCLESDMSPKMHCTALESPLNCLAVNKDCSQVVVAGRNVFKIFDIVANGEFVERINLRVGRSLNLNFSAADVTWNPIDGHLLASAATNGAVVLWNLNKSSRSKQEHVFVEHRQAVNRVAFHYSEGNLLISGSRDGSMKLFDLRKETVATTFGGHMDSVRDVQFNPHHYFMFASAYENGNIQVSPRNASTYLFAIFLLVLLHLFCFFVYL